MPKILSNLNDLTNKFSGLISLFQVVMPALAIAAFYVFTLYLDANYLRKSDYESDRSKTEQVFEEIKGKLNTIINSQTGFSAQLNGVQDSLKDHSERLRYLERTTPLVRK